MNYPLVTISVINYNDRKFIFTAIESAVEQDYPNLQIIVTDNNSTDGTKEEIEAKILQWKEKRSQIAKKYHGNFYPDQVGLVKNSENAGFGRPHNNAIRISKGEFILLLNSDAILAQDYVEKALEPFADPGVGSVQGKLLRYDFRKNELCKSKEKPDCNVIDTTGLLMFKNRRIVCVGQGEPDEGQFETETEIFGADGAVPVYRKSALEDVKMPVLQNQKPNTKDQNQMYEYFDENFFMYKEDVDLAWRMRLYGWKAVYDPRAVAYHGRGSGDSMATNYLSIIRERRKINNRAKYMSFKHQRLMQIKNEQPSLLLKHLPQLAVKEVGAWIYMMTFERFAFRVLKDFYHDAPLAFKKRKIIMSRKRVGAKEMEKWFK